MRQVLLLSEDLLWVSFDKSVSKALKAWGPGPEFGVGLHQELVTHAELVKPRLDLIVLTDSVCF